MFACLAHRNSPVLMKLPWTRDWFLSCVAEIAVKGCRSPDWVFLHFHVWDWSSQLKSQIVQIPLQSFIPCLFSLLVAVKLKLKIVSQGELIVNLRRNCRFLFIGSDSYVSWNFVAVFVRSVTSVDLTSLTHGNAGKLNPGTGSLWLQSQQHRTKINLVFMVISLILLSRVCDAVPVKQTLDTSNVNHLWWDSNSFQSNS